MSDFPQRFGPYVLERFIAAGGMAEVFLARRDDGAIDGPLALKRMLAEMMKTPEYATMFRDEAALSARLVHKNIVRVFDFGEADGRMYMAMELIDGVDVATLQKRLRQRNEMLGVPHALKIGVDLCAGLFHAHTLVDEQRRPLKLIHRDISPQNILISSSGEVKVTDFGIAKAVGRETKTATGMIKGKVQYMAPEQALGHHIDQRVDQFAAGIVVWEMLTGQRLFAEKTELLTFEKIIRKPTPKPSAVRSAIPAHVDEVVLRALAKSADERWPDLNAFGTALAHSLAKMGGPPAADLAPVMAYLMGSSTPAALSPPPGATPPRAKSAPPPKDTSAAASAPTAASIAAATAAPPPATGKRSGLSVVSPATAPTVLTPSARLPTNAMTPLPADTGPSGLELKTRDGPTMRLPTPMMPMNAPIGIEPMARNDKSQVLAAAAPRGFPIGAMAMGLLVGAVLGYAGAKLTSKPAGANDACASPAADRAARESAAKMLDDAQLAYNTGDLPRAAKLANEALASSGSPRAYAMLATIHLANGNLAETLRADHCLVLVFPDSEERKVVEEQMKPRATQKSAPSPADRGEAP